MKLTHPPHWQFFLVEFSEPPAVWSSYSSGRLCCWVEWPEGPVKGWKSPAEASAQFSENGGADFPPESFCWRNAIRSLPACSISERSPLFYCICLTKGLVSGGPHIISSNVLWTWQNKRNIMSLKIVLQCYDPFFRWQRQCNRWFCHQNPGSKDRQNRARDKPF